MYAARINRTIREDLLLAFGAQQSHQQLRLIRDDSIHSYFYQTAECLLRRWSSCIDLPGPRKREAYGATKKEATVIDPPDIKSNSRLRPER